MNISKIEVQNDYINDLCDNIYDTCRYDNNSAKTTLLNYPYLYLLNYSLSEFIVKSAPYICRKCYDNIFWITTN